MPRTLIEVVEAGLIAVKESEIFLVPRIAEGAGDLLDGGLLRAGGDAVFEYRLFHGENAAGAPTGCGEVFDHRRFGLVDGVEAIDEGIVEILEHIRVFVGQDDGLGEQAMTERIAR
jgi:hypothetical protein